MRYKLPVTITFLGEDGFMAHCERNKGSIYCSDECTNSWKE